jgi:hypothetical protein
MAQVVLVLVDRFPYRLEFLVVMYKLAESS